MEDVDAVTPEDVAPGAGLTVERLTTDDGRQLLLYSWTEVE